MKSQPVATSHPSLDKARFIPGTVLATRYRIISLLGRGGMGEVYRADDLKLGQPVALKFLPGTVEKDRSRLERLLNEVKMARQVAHPNVCRVYDVGEVDGHHFISMEFIDGEDLASLLRQIGRLPEEKATQIARQLCAGLAAAHEQGILHRDLKPANVMIDGRGRVRITDFGLAVLAEAIKPEDVVAGTPAYMAPEQHRGEDVTVRSDVYSLGLVLYELFTGKRAFDAASPAEIRKLQEESTPTNPSSHVEGLDQAVERMILRCLEREPIQRPASALAIAAGLPGGDPLTAALAAGETPSPEMVANAGGEGALRPGVAVAWLTFFLLVLAVFFWQGSAFPNSHNLYSYVPLDKPPQVLVHDAREILRVVGHNDEPTDYAYGFDVDFDYLDHIKDNDQSLTRWERLASGQPAALYFWYRQSPRILFPERGMNMIVNADDPPLEVSGMANVELDMTGRLRAMRIVPPQLVEDAGPVPAPAWSVLFEAAGLDIETFTPVNPVWVPNDFCDSRAAWKGTYASEPDIEIRVEAGSFQGKPSWFEIIDPWMEPRRMEEQSADPSIQTVGIFGGILFIAIMVGALLLARNNLRQKRGDRRGATRLALFSIVVAMVVWTLTASHVPEFFGEFGMLMERFAEVFLSGCLIWLIYIALEPFLRRRWPEALVGWNRVLAGRFRDPRIGRDILAGAVGAGLLGLVSLFHDQVMRWLKQPIARPEIGTSPDFLLGFNYVVAHLGNVLASSVLIPVIILFVLLLFRIMLRKQWLAMTVIVVLVELWNLLTLSFMGASHPISILLILAHNLIFWVIIFFLFARIGLLGLCAFFFFLSCVSGLPPVDPTVWYGTGAVFFLVVASVLALLAFYVSLGGRSLLGRGLVPEA